MNALRRPVSPPLVVSATALAALACLAGPAACHRSPTDSERFTTAVPPLVQVGHREPSPVLRPVTPLPVLSSEIPVDTGPTGPDSALQKHHFDILSWRSFVAMNWPARPDGRPDQTQIPGQNGDNNTVWGTWNASSEIIGPEVPSVGRRAPLPAILRDLPAGVRILSQIDNPPGLIDPINTFNTGPLIDQNGRYARFEILVNEPMLAALDGQNRFAPNTPALVGHATGSASDAGATLVKAAWKILTPSEVASGRFHAIQTVIYTPPSTTPSVKETIEQAAVGLVGLQIARRTTRGDGWIWSTFEHVDNCPTAGEPADRAAYNFYDKAAPDAPANTPPARPWDPTVTEPPARRPQIVRRATIDTPTRVLNATYQAAFRAVNPASVWQYYELVGTRWPSAPGDTVAAATKGFPASARPLNPTP